jgi:predicted ribosomally synthesized peptide with SipW-like signal peptide
MKRLGILCLAVVLAIGMLGIGYAAWTDEVTIDGTVDTGILDVAVLCSALDATDGALSPWVTGWIVGSASAYADTTANSQGPGFEVSVTKQEKNVGWVELDCQGDYPDTATVTLNNVYPCYLNHITGGLYNAGNIPFKLDHVLILDSAGNVLEKMTASGQYMTFDLLPIGAPNGTPDLEIQWGDNFGEQAEPGDYLDISFFLHVMQDEDIDFTVPHSYSITFKFVGVQWNAYPLP